MPSHWYIYVIIAVVAELLYMACDRVKFIKSKTMRYVLALFISTIICWSIYDLIA